MWLCKKLNDRFLENNRILIDQLILQLPSAWFVEAPFLSALLSNPNGRYVLTGILMVAGLIVFGLFSSLFRCWLGVV